MNYVVMKMDQTVSFERAHCDKYDYMIAASCGIMAGLVDAFFVGMPGKKVGELSVLQAKVDQGADQLVIKAAQGFYKFDKRTSGKPKKMPESLQKCISYLEQAFPVTYDARYAKDLIADEGVLSNMSSSNHHLLSLSHSPDIIGLIFSIIDQFDTKGKGSFVDHGTVVRLVPKKRNGSVPYLQGSTLISRLFCGFVNWIGHLLSDMVGASSTRQPEKTGRGAGIPMPFYEMLTFANFGHFDGNTVADIAIKAFENGYDARFAGAMAVPVVLNDLFIRFLWSVKKHFYAQCPWKQCIPMNKHDDLRVMLLVGNGCLCVVDGIDAFAKSSSDPVAFVLRLNLIAWGKLTLMAIKEVTIRLSRLWDDLNIPEKVRFVFVQADLVLPFAEVQEAVNAYLQELEKIDMEAFKKETRQYNVFCKCMLETTSEEELNILLKSYMKKMGFDLPWEGDFDTFMSNRNNHLVFS